MKKLLLISVSFIFILSGCAPSSEEKKEIATATCNIMGASRTIDSAFRLKQINEARKEIRERPYTATDQVIIDSLSLGLCSELVLNDPEYNTKYLDKYNLQREREMTARALEAMRAREQTEREEKQRQQKIKKYTSKVKEHFKKYAKLDEIKLIGGLRDAQSFDFWIDIMVPHANTCGFDKRITVYFKNNLGVYNSSRTNYCSIAGPNQHLQDFDVGFGLSDNVEDALMEIMEKNGKNLVQAYTTLIDEIYLEFTGDLYMGTLNKKLNNFERNMLNPETYGLKYGTRYDVNEFENSLRFKIYP